MAQDVSLLVMCSCYVLWPSPDLGDGFVWIPLATARRGRPHSMRSTEPAFGPSPPMPVTIACPGGCWRSRHRGPAGPASCFRPMTSPAVRIKGQARQAACRAGKKTAFRLRPNLPFFPRHDPLTRSSGAVGRAAPSPLCPGECQRPFPRKDRGGFAQGASPSGNAKPRRQSHDRYPDFHRKLFYSAEQARP